jgi:hypothetical protein
MPIQNSLFLPVFVQITLTFILLFRMAFYRVSSVASGEIKMKDIALGQNAWNEKTIKVQNSFHNQLELPFLFYFVVIIAAITNLNSNVFVVLTWIFAISRIFHALIHNTTNRVSLRFRFFAMGSAALLACWVVLAIHLFFTA